ncbi:unnamed protein product [Sympodiomycopsis kandeliae]
MPPSSSDHGESHASSPAATSLSTHLHNANSASASPAAHASHSHTSIAQHHPSRSATASPTPSLHSLSEATRQHATTRPQSSGSALFNRAKPSSPAPAAATATASVGIVAGSSVATPRASAKDDERIWRSAAARKAERNWKRQSEKSLSADSRYRKYASVIDRALGSFESVAEWADFVGALGRLEKIFSAPPPLPTSIIPRSLLLSKRLSQCLNPALPSGVHHRALSVYRQIFLQLSTDGLRRDLAIWSPGLLPFFERANTSTRPVVLALLEEFYLPLGDDLKPMTRALVLAVLPGLEEEGAENFDRTLKLLEGLQRCVGQTLFWHCLWAGIATKTGIRQAAINFLVKRPPPFKNKAEAVPYSPTELKLISRAFSALLTSSDLLIVRGGLDLLLEYLPLHSELWQKTPSAERISVTKSAIGVVLRRELSLNRRLWTWFGGTASERLKVLPQSTERQEGDDEENQEVAYLKKFGIDVLKESLLSDMTAIPPIAISAQKSKGKDRAPQVADSDDDSSEDDMPAVNDTSSADLMAARQRPYRIFLALLDKWSVGSLLTSVLALDAYRAAELQTRGAIAIASASSLDATAKQADAEAKELLLTVSMLFDAMDKDIFCDRILDEIRKELTGQGADGDTQESSSKLFAFILKHFSFKDDISRNIHLPNMLAAILTLVFKNLFSKDCLYPTEAAAICRTLLPLIPKQVFEPPSQARASQDMQQEDGRFFDESVAEFYCSSPSKRQPIDFQQGGTLGKLVGACAATSLQAIYRGLSDIAISLLSLISNLFQVLTQARQNSPVSQKVGWYVDFSSHSSCRDASWWTRHLAMHSHRTKSFAECDAILTALVDAANCSALSERVDLHESPNPQTIVTRLISALQPDHSPHHSRVVTLFWRFQEIYAASGCMSSLFCSRLTDVDDSESFASGLEAFGAIWRHSTEEALLSDSMSAPLGRVLDLLRSSDLDRRQCGETWLRSNVRSYTPIFHFFLAGFERTGLHQTSRKPMETMCEQQITIEGMAYARPFDHEVLNYLLGTLVAVARYGAAGFVRGARVEVDPSTQWEFSPTSSRSVTYLDHFVSLAFLLLRTDANTSLNSTPSELFQKQNAVTHSLAADLLQILASRGALSSERLSEAETLLLGRLHISVQTGTIHRQHKLLLTLHTIIATRFAQQAQTRPSESAKRQQNKQNDVGSTIRAHPLLLPAIATAITKEDNRSVLAHWVDFILMTVPFYRRDLKKFLVPLNDRMCRSVKVFERTLRGVIMGAEATSTATSADETNLTLLLTAFEKVMALCLDEGHAAAIGHHEREDSVMRSPNNTITLPPAAAKAAPRHENSGGGSSQPASAKEVAEPSSGLFGYVSGIFGGETSTESDGLDHKPESRTNVTVSALQLAVGSLHGLWTVLNLNARLSALGESHEAFTLRIKARCRRILERLYKGSSSATAEALIDCWNHSSKPSRGGESAQEAVFEILSILTPGAQTLVTFLCDTLSTRLPSPGTSKPTWTPDQIVTDTTLLAFLEAFSQRISVSDAGAVWPVLVILIKDLLANSAAHKAYLFPALRILTTLGDKLIQGSHADDKKLRRELQETYTKLFDLCILIAGRSFDSTTWIRRSARETATPDVADSTASLDEKAPGIPSETSAPTSAQTIVAYLAQHGLPALRKFVTDSDKVATTGANAVYYIIAPPLRAKNADLSVAEEVLALASELAKIPGALKPLKSAISDAFWDSRFFRLQPSAAQKWRTPVLTLYKADKERFLELLGRISAAPTANININIFANRQAEIVLRAQNLRRLSYVIYSADQNQFLPLLPAIQEKLVDVLRANSTSHAGADVVNAEVYLCLRTMLCRFDSQHLLTLWPIVITEMMRLFDGVIEAITTLSAETLQLVLSACKFLDVLVTMQVDDFQMQQWLFINDTGLSADESMEESILDRLATSIDEHLPGSKRSSKQSSTVFGKSKTRSHKGGRRPILAGVIECSSIEQLLPFLRQVSSPSFGDDVTHASDTVDVKSIERDLRADMFKCKTEK